MINSAASEAANTAYSLLCRHSEIPNSCISPMDPSTIFKPALTFPYAISTLRA